MRFNGLTKGFFILILALVTWAFFDVLLALLLRDTVGRDPDHHL
ncbi:protein YdiK [Enterobacter cancerogenus]|uniref:Protein YdiK n=1 Tax=Enterobacter cancerogenus TaxID=69218 RepID=A0A484XQ24_9ENTR|nr:protein YdiK [Enterobacter cancerogenus]